MGVHLSSGVAISDVDLGLVDETDDLDVTGGLDVLETGDGARRNDAGSTARLRAPGDGLTLGVTDEGVGLGGTPDTPVVGVVDEGGLAEGLGALSGRVAQVVTELGTTEAVVGVDLEGLRTQGE